MFVRVEEDGREKKPVIYDNTDFKTALRESCKQLKTREFETSGYAVVEEVEKC